jgi:hypothetical protein
VPIYKGGEKDQPGNYMPISILPVFSKILEKIVKTRLLHFLNSNNFFYKCQYGFRNRINTVTAITDTITALDQNQIAGGIFIDLKKAFDTIDRVKLIAKMEVAGIRGLAKDWFKSYLENRMQYVNVNGVKSNEKNIDLGVPQGFILGPILFLIHINDINNLKLKGNLVLFADDILIIYIGDNEIQIMENMQHDLELLLEWFKVNMLTINDKLKKKNTRKVYS